MDGHKFNVDEFLAWEMSDRDVGKEKLLLEYPCLITHLYLSTGLQELPSIYEMIKATNTTDLY